MANFSFDIVSDYDKAEINNVFDQVKREIDARYDFKNTPADIEWFGDDKSGFKLTGNSDFQIDAIIDIVRKKLAARGLSQKMLDVSKEIHTNNMKSSKELPFIKGLTQEKSKKITLLLREKLPKVKAQIQGEEVRITSPKNDELQMAMQIINEHDFDFPLQFTNYR
jgi:uncharacterized protein YajQ (UPF0234 family)